MGKGAQFEIDGIGIVEVVKHATSKKLKLSFTRAGVPRVTIPTWAPIKAGVLFASKNAEWIAQHAPTHSKTRLIQGQRIGKSGTLVFIEDETRDTAISRIKQMAITITIPPDNHFDDETQQVAAKACERYLRLEAEQLLPGRLAQLARKHGIDYGSVSVKRLQARWGSCSSSRDIVLNYFLMQLPWHLIDYVLLHELNHIKHMHHGAEFWNSLEHMIPDAKDRKRAMKEHKPVL